MKNFGGTFIFAAIVAAVGIYAYVVEYKGAEKKETAKQEAARLVPYKSDEISGVTSQSGDQSLEISKNSAGEWELQSPVKDLADTTLVNGWLTQVLEQKSEDVVVEGESVDWVVYGLDKPKGKITIKTKDGKATSVTVGINEAMGGRRYVRVGEEKKVYLASVLWDGFVTKVPKDVRDHRIQRKSKDGVKGLKIVAGGTTLDLEKTEKGWEAKSKPEYALDSVVIDGFIDTVSGVKTTDFAAEAKGDKSVVSKYRLNEKGPELTLTWSDNTTWSAKVGSAKDGKAYLTTSGSETVYEVAATDVERWSKTWDDFRDKKKPFELKKEDVKEIEVKTSLIKLNLKRGQSNWEMSNPDSAKEVDQEKVGHLLEKIESLRADKFLGKSASLKSAKGEMIFKDQAGQVLLELKWGDFAKDPKINLVKTNKSDEGLGVNSELIGGLPSQTLLKDKVVPSPATSPQLSQAPTQAKAGP